MHNENRFFRTVAAGALLAFLLLANTACRAPRYAQPAPDAPRTVVVWISIDGVRPDYLTRTSLPFFEKLRQEGAYSDALAPGFPSLTFPNHVLQATGVEMEHHGIPLNSFYDAELDEVFRYPGDGSLLQAEPIWQVAQRQGRRVAVHDWVLSYAQAPDEAASSSEAFDPDLTDRQRVGQVLRSWRRDRDAEPLQLLMGYMLMPDKVGHEVGPDAPGISEVMEQTDAKLAWFTERALRLFRRRMDPGRDVFYLILTSDHGMSEVHTGVHPLGIAGIYGEEVGEDGIVMAASANLTHLFFHKIADEEERAARKARVIEAVAEHDFVAVYRRDELPGHWGYRHPTRVGDLVLSLETGYSFGRRTPGITAPQRRGQVPIGMHGYDVEDNPEMNGIALVWRYPEPLGGVDLGPIHSLQLHATVAALLGIEPAEKARPDPIRID